MPSIPAGPAGGYIRTSYSYNTSANDSDGDQIRYGFDWGDGKSSISSLVNSGTVGSMAHSWNRAGTYRVRVNATDSHGLRSNYSAARSMAISSANRPPLIPTAPVGPGTGVVISLYPFSAVSSDPDGDLIKYVFSWGDGGTSETPFLPTGQGRALFHSWAAPGRYSIKVRAQDYRGSSSG